MLLKECRDIQLRCGSASNDYDGDMMSSDMVTSPTNQFTSQSDVQKIISDRLVCSGLLSKVQAYQCKTGLLVSVTYTVNFTVDL